MEKIKIGFLPLYIKLYDDIGTDRTFMQAFYDRMAGILKAQGFDVIKTDFCRIKEEFKSAVEKFENDGADVDSNLVFIIIGIVLLFLIVLLIILYFVYRAYRERKEEHEDLLQRSDYD